MSPTVVAMTQWSQSAYRHGDYIAKYAVFPKGEAQKKLVNTYIKDSDPINVISQEVRNFHLNNKVTYSFCAQLCENLEECPVEDIGVTWDEKKYPFVEIATLEFDPQDSWYVLHRPSPNPLLCLRLHLTFSQKAPRVPRLVGRPNHRKLVARPQGPHAPRQHQPRAPRRLRRVAQAAPAHERLQELRRAVQPRRGAGAHRAAAADAALPERHEEHGGCVSGPRVVRCCMNSGWVWCLARRVKGGLDGVESYACQSSANESLINTSSFAICFVTKDALAHDLRLLPRDPVREHPAPAAS